MFGGPSATHMHTLASGHRKEKERKGVTTKLFDFTLAHNPAHCCAFFCPALALQASWDERKNCRGQKEKNAGTKGRIAGGKRKKMLGQKEKNAGTKGRIAGTIEGHSKPLQVSTRTGQEEQGRALHPGRS
eukprot:1157237-Pelagomonas_calceolata.AAC.1